MDPFQDQEEGGTEDWLVSYADMMTLIACFFILMMAFANYDPVGFNKKAEQLSKHFRVDKSKSSMMKFKHITEEIARHELKDRTKVSVKDGELVISFSSSVLFPKGDANLSPMLETTLDSLIDIIKVSNPNYRVLVEGHADDEGHEPMALSAQRAVSVAKRFSQFGFPEERIVPIARGSNMPLVESQGKEGILEEKAKMNRRVVIRILEPYKKKKVKFGLGVYFKDATENTAENPISSQDADGFEISQ